jgi:hypothetical protein
VNGRTKRRRLVFVAAMAIGCMVAACGDIVTGGGTPAPASPRSEVVAVSPTVPTTTPIVTAPVTTDEASATTTVPREPSPASRAERPEPTATEAPPSPVASPTPARTYACHSGPCPRNLAYAVNGCSCVDQVYEDSRVSAPYCCASGYSDSPCPESSADQPILRSMFGSTERQIESQLVTVSLQGRPATVHAKAQAAFQRVAERLKNVEYRIREPIGSFNWRVTQGSDILSTHSFGLAVDINPTTHPRCGVTRDCQCNNDLITDIPPDFVQTFKNEGFEWGGDWAEHPDPMHFEWAGWRH